MDLKQREDAHIGDDVLLPLTDAAAMLAHDQWPDTDDSRERAALRYRLKYPEAEAPMLNGRPDPDGYLATAVHETEREIQRAIDRLLELGELRLLSFDTCAPTLDAAGAFILRQELASLMMAGKHLRAASPLAAPTDSPAKPVQRQAAQDVADTRAVVTHRLGRDLLAPVIDRVCSEVSNASDSAAVMAQLERLARLPEKDRPAPLAGVTSGGVKWRDGGTVKSLTRKALGGRLRRRAQAR